MTPYDFHGDKCLTVRQRRVLRWIVKYHDKHKYMPSYREIAKGVRMSHTGVKYCLLSLEKKGALWRNARDEARCCYLLPQGAPVVGEIEGGRVKWRGFA